MRLLALLAMTLALLGAGCGDGTVRPPSNPLPSPSNGGTQTPGDPLRPQAESLVRALLPEAILVEVVATASSGSAMTADDVDTFEYRFAADPFDPQGGTAWIEARNGQFQPVAWSSQAMTSVVLAELPDSMSLADAITAMRAAGFDEPFRRVLFRRLSGTFASFEATYAFERTDGFVVIGVVTGAVSETTFQPEPESLIREF
ncbi:MAG: hypothetical protein JXA69_16840 [Phycisphaerae bacterium]|nr:hypothetical protein [Phycisphaerae bacterium]